MCYLDCSSACNRTVHYMATTVAAGAVDSNSNTTACWIDFSGCSQFRGLYKFLLLYPLKLFAAIMIFILASQPKHFSFCINLKHRNTIHPSFPGKVSVLLLLRNFVLESCKIQSDTTSHMSTAFLTLSKNILTFQI